MSTVPIIIRVALIVVAVAVEAAFLVYALDVTDIAEDSRWFNCHLHGNYVCGTTPGPAGFPNLLDPPA